MKKISKVMNSLNAHNPKLVDTINNIFNDDKCVESRRQILFALAQRDADEIKDKLGIVINNYEDVDMFDTELLMHVCDDRDLEVIIAFCYDAIQTYHEVLIKELQALKSRDIVFAGDFEFYALIRGDFKKVKLVRFDKTSENAIALTILYCDKTTNITHIAPFDVVAAFEIERVANYIMDCGNNQTFRVRVVASREFEVVANCRDAAIEMAQQQLIKEPLYEGDIDGFSIV